MAIVEKSTAREAHGQGDRPRDAPMVSLSEIPMSSSLEINVTTRGEVDERSRDRARRKLGELERLAGGAVITARVVLTREANPTIPLPARAEAELDVDGRLIQARAVAASMQSAVDEVADRLRRQLRRNAEMKRTRHDGAAARLGRRTQAPRAAPPWFGPYDADREIIKCKSFAFGPMLIEEAADALEDLDHDFFLFHDASSGADAVVYWRDDGLLALIEPRAVAERITNTGAVLDTDRFSGPVSLQTALAEMNEVGHRFLFFENLQTGRGNVIYRRHDGHYGLVEPA